MSTEVVLCLLDLDLDLDIFQNHNNMITITNYDITNQPLTIIANLGSRIRPKNKVFYLGSSPLCKFF